MLVAGEGLHDPDKDVTTDEAFSLFLNTYLFLGEVLHLSLPQDSTATPEQAV